MKNSFLIFQLVSLLLCVNGRSTSTAKPEEGVLVSVAVFAIWLLITTGLLIGLIVTCIAWYFTRKMMKMKMEFMRKTNEKLLDRQKKEKKPSREKEKTSSNSKTPSAEASYQTSKETTGTSSGTATAKSMKETLELWNSVERLQKLQKKAAKEDTVTTTKTLDTKTVGSLRKAKKKSAKQKKTSTSTEDAETRTKTTEMDSIATAEVKIPSEKAYS
ncbi:unnamed protein product [Caenorhabditis sp. 36 PRJEB53466]|nr:unnamed protein product [Caenorhabditis sp. 36 PRJEB53466]